MLTVNRERNNSVSAIFFCLLRFACSWGKKRRAPCRSNFAPHCFAHFNQRTKWYWVSVPMSITQPISATFGSTMTNTYISRHFFFCSPEGGPHFAAVMTVKTAMGDFLLFNWFFGSIRLTNASLGGFRDPTKTRARSEEKPQLTVFFCHVTHFAVFREIM